MLNCEPLSCIFCTQAFIAAADFELALCLGYLYGGNPNAPSFSKFEDSMEWYNFKKSPQLDYYTTPIAANLSALDDPVGWLNEQSDRISSYATSLNLTEADLPFVQYTQSCIGTLAMKIDGEITDEVQSIYNFCMSHFGWEVDEEFILYGCDAYNDLVVEMFNSSEQIYFNSSEPIFAYVIQQCRDTSSKVGGGGIITPSNLKPPGSGTDNFLSVKYPELVLEEESFKFYHQTVTRRFGEENHTFSSRAFVFSDTEEIQNYEYLGATPIM
jgi:hypothetical protein